LPEECPCKGLGGWRLVECLAPPRGEYEVSYELGRGVTVSISREGIRVRQLKNPGYLPYLESVEREVKPEVLESMGISPGRVLCDVIEALRKASTHGSETAAAIINRCARLIESLEEDCRA